MTKRQNAATQNADGRMTFRQIAAALGISHGTVQNDYWRAIAKLAEATGLEPLEAPPSKYQGGHRQRVCRKCGRVGHYAGSCR